jgi:hypothetical protein
MPGLAGGPIAQPPRTALLKPATLTSSEVPLAVSWPVATPQGAPVQSYQLQVRLDEGSWTDVPLAGPLARKANINLRPWQYMTFRVRATDTAAVTGAWATADPVWLATAQSSDDEVDYSAGWQSVNDSNSFAGGRLTTSSAGASASHTFVGREVAWIAIKGKLKGIADVYLDGELAATVDLRKSSTAKRRVVFRAAWPTTSEHTIEVVARGTSGRPTIDIDAFVVLGAAATQTMVGAGDIASCDDNDDEETAAVVETVDGIVFTVGDNVYPNGTAENFANCYGPSWGAFKDRTRPGIGNHEFYNVPGATGYFSYFGEAAGPPGRGYYRFNAGTWRVFALTSECTQTSQCMADQLAWLEANLDAEPHRCTLALWHRPRLSTGDHGPSMRMAAALQILYDHGADLIVAGHDHGYQRFAPSDPAGQADPETGIRQFVAGMGGASLYAWESDHPLIETRDNTTHGVLRLDLAPGGYSWQFLPSDGSYTDSGSDTCH